MIDEFLQYLRVLRVVENDFLFAKVHYNHNPVAIILMNWYEDVFFVEYVDIALPSFDIFEVILVRSRFLWGTGFNSVEKFRNEKGGKEGRIFEFTGQKHGVIVDGRIIYPLVSYFEAGIVSKFQKILAADGVIR